MTEDFCINGRHFRTKTEYDMARKELAKIEKLREKLTYDKTRNAKLILAEIRKGNIRFTTILGRDFTEELEDITGEVPGFEAVPVKSKQVIRDESVKKPVAPKRPSQKPQVQESSRKREPQRKEEPEELDPVMQKYVEQALRMRELKRKLFRMGAILFSFFCLGYFVFYLYQQKRTEDSYEALEELKNKPYIGATVAGNQTVSVTLDGAREVPEVLEEYKNLLNVNQRLIGWIKIDDNIDSTKTMSSDKKYFMNYPVMQTDNNEYYLDHNLNQEYDKNGSIFMDKDCDVLAPSTNLILYGHHMKSGAMFGNLNKYESQDFCDKHPYIDFDTIYEKGIYRVMYVFRSKVSDSSDIGFKYYQFIDANGPQEFDSNMNEMKAISLVDTGVTAVYGDRLLTLTTCDYQETNGRFVVVAKKVLVKE